MSMAIFEPTQAKETYTQRRARKQREVSLPLVNSSRLTLPSSHAQPSSFHRADSALQAEDRARPPSKKALEEAAAASRDEGLATALDASSRGFRMLAKLGFQPGTGLGPSRDAPTAADAATSDRTKPPAAEGPRLEPLVLDVKADRGGIGLDDARKRKVRHAAGAERVAKRARVEESGVDFRERVAREREEQRLARLVPAVMRVAERMDEAAAPAGAAHGPGDGTPGGARARASRPPPLQEVNVLYRSLERDRRTAEHDRRMRHEMLDSLPTGKGRLYDDPEEDAQDRMALGKEVEELPGDESDEELDAFEALAPEQKLARLTAYLREKHWYCFWCKCQYEDEGMEGCPGEKEEDHD